jgi:hypothetical protein
MTSRFTICLALAVMYTVAGVDVGACQERSSAAGPAVHMVVTVEARHGSDVPVINREDAMVYEGRERDQVVDWVPLKADHAALDLFILVDDGSTTSLGSQLEDLRQCINAQPPTTRIGVAYMQNGVAQIVQDLTSDHALAARSLRLPLGIPGINASPYFSLGDLIKRWPESSIRREVLMVSDGIDRYWGPGPDDPYVPEVIEHAQKAGIIVFAIYTPGVGHLGHNYWSTYWGQIYLSRTAEETGGEGYYIGFYGPPVSFAPYLEDLSKRLNHQYLLTFLAKPEKKSGMQRVRLRTEVPNAELVAADQVYVPAGP